MTTAEDRALLHVEQTGTLMDVPLAHLQPNPHQPRAVFDPDELQALAASLTINGLIAPITVRQLNPDAFELVVGERRWRAAELAGWGTIPAIVRDVDDTTQALLAVIENIDRTPLNPVEEGQAYARLIDANGWTQDELAQTVNRSRAHISHAIAITRLPEPVRNRVAAGVLSFGHAKVLCGLKDPWVVERLADTIIREGLTVRMVEERIALGDLPGWEDTRAGKARSPRKSPVEIRDAATMLMDVLDTRVVVKAGASRGRIVIDFADRTDLDRILVLLTTAHLDQSETGPTR